MKKKITYRVRNWKDYNRGLINRGNLTIWFSEDAINGWYQQPQEHIKRGRPFTYSNSYIELALTLRTLFRFPLRATQGFLEGLVSLLGLKLQISHYSQLSRRASTLDVQLKLKKKDKAITDLVIDSTGLKIFGEGEWKMRTHGKQKEEVGANITFSVNPDTHEVTAVELTESNVHDSKILPLLLSKQKNIGRIYADGAYTFKGCFDAIAEVGGEPLIPVLSGTCLVSSDPSPDEQLRNELLENIRKAGGRAVWKKTSGYHRRSLVETHMLRLKSILGGSLKGRKFDNQKVEAKLMAKILNKMASLGMPKSEKCA